MNFSWKDERGNLQQGQGFARDLSAGGLFLLSRSCPPAGVPIQFEAWLPALDPGSRILRMQGEGRVLRVETAVEADGEQWEGFAATSESIELRDMERKFLRYRVGIPVIYSWKDKNGRPQRAKGLARDLSAGGLFLVSRMTPPEGVLISFEAFLPPLGPGAPPLRMQGEGRVLRVESAVEGDSEQQDGFAAVSDSVVLSALE